MPERAGAVRVTRGGVGGRDQVLLGHQVGVDVVVDDGAVLVRPGDAVDAEPSVDVVVAERAPQPGRLGQQLQADVALEGVVAGGVDVADDRVGDVGVDVKRGRTRRPVAGTLLAVDGAPRKRRTLSPSWTARSPAQPQRGVPPAQRVGGGMRCGVGQHRQHERLGVPERVPVVARAGQALRRDRASFGPGTGLQDVEQREPDRLLDGRDHRRPRRRRRPRTRRGTPAARRPARPSRTAAAASAASTWSRTAGSDRVADQPYATNLTSRSRCPGASVAVTVTRPRSGTLPSAPGRLGPSTRWSIPPTCSPLAGCGARTRRRSLGVLFRSSGASSRPPTRGSPPTRDGSASLATSSDCTTIRAGASSGSTS